MTLNFRSSRGVQFYEVLGMEFVAPYLMPARQVSVLLIELHLQPLVMVFIWQFILYKFLSIGHIFSNNVHIDSLQLRILHIFEIMYAQKRVSLCILLLMPYASMLIVSSAYTFQRLLLFLWILSSKTSIHHHQQGMSVLDSDILMGYLNIFDNYIWKQCFIVPLIFTCDCWRGWLFYLTCISYFITAYS